MLIYESAGSAGAIIGLRGIKVTKNHQIDLASIGAMFRMLLDQTQQPHAMEIMRSHSNSRRDCFDDAVFRISVLKRAGQRVSLPDITAQLFGDHPWCGMSQAELSAALGKLVIGRGVLIGVA